MVEQKIFFKVVISFKISIFALVNTTRTKNAINIEML